MPSATARSVDAETVTRLRASIGRLARQMRLSATHAGLTPTEMSVLSTVVRTGPLRVADLQAVEAINPTMLSRVVGKLADAGLVSRASDRDDRRSVTVTVTPAGRRTHDQVRAERNRTLATILESLPAEQRDAIVSALPALEALSFGLSP